MCFRVEERGKCEQQGRWARECGASLSLTHVSFRVLFPPLAHGSTPYSHRLACFQVSHIPASHRAEMEVSLPRHVVEGIPSRHRIAGLLMLGQYRTVVEYSRSMLQKNGARHLNVRAMDLLNYALARLCLVWFSLYMGCESCDLTELAA